MKSTSLSPHWRARKDCPGRSMRSAASRHRDEGFQGRPGGGPGEPRRDSRDGGQSGDADSAGRVAAQRPTAAGVPRGVVWIDPGLAGGGAGAQGGPTPGRRVFEVHAQAGTAYAGRAGWPPAGAGEQALGGGVFRPGPWRKRRRKRKAAGARDAGKRHYFLRRERPEILAFEFPGIPGGARNRRLGRGAADRTGGGKREALPTGMAGDDAPRC